MRNRMAMRSRRPAAGVPRERSCRNGSEMRKMVPLWKGGERRMWRRGSVVGEQWERHAATAENRGKCCRCGRGTGWQCGPEGLQQGCREKGHAATAAKCRKCCRCGNVAKVECGPGSLYQWCREKGNAATAAKCRKWCRCGKVAKVECGAGGL